MSNPRPQPPRRSQRIALRNHVPQRGIQYFVKLVNSRMITLEFNENTTGRDVKMDVRAATGIHGCEEVRLTFAGKVLEDDRLLSFYKIGKEATVEQVLRLLGGKPVIFLYSPVPRIVTVEINLASFWSLHCVYPGQPNYTDLWFHRWAVLANPGGELQELPSSIKTSYLFWEAVSELSPQNALPLMTSHTRVVSGDSFLPILREALEDLLLDVAQQTDFITYWKNEFDNLERIAFRFATPDEMNRVANLRIRPVPAIVHRVFLVFGRAPVGAVDVEVDWQEVVMGGVDMGGWRDDVFCVLEWVGCVWDEGLPWG